MLSLSEIQQLIEEEKKLLIPHPETLGLSRHDLDDKALSLATDMQLIANGLYIGNKAAHLALKDLPWSSFSANVVCIEKMSLPQEKNNTIDYLHFPLTDAMDGKKILPKSFLPVFKFIDDSLKRGNVLINCQAGSGRSATVVTAYVIYHFPSEKIVSHSVEALIEMAFRQVQRKRQCADIRHQQPSLVDFATMIKIRTHKEQWKLKLQLLYNKIKKQIPLIQNEHLNDIPEEMHYRYPEMIPKTHQAVCSFLGTIISGLLIKGLNLKELFLPEEILNVVSVFLNEHPQWIADGQIYWDETELFELKVQLNKSHYSATDLKETEKVEFIIGEETPVIPIEQRELISELRNYLNLSNGSLGFFSETVPQHERKAILTLLERLEGKEQHSEFTSADMNTLLNSEGNISGTIMRYIETCSSLITTTEKMPGF